MASLYQLITVVSGINMDNSETETVSGSSPPGRYQYAFLLLGALILAAFFRLKGLAFQSMWLDEISTLWYCSPERSFSIIFDYCLNGEVNPPFFYFLIWIWQKAFGTAEYTVRLLPAIAGILGVAAIYLLGRELFSPRSGIYAALLAALLPIHIYYSQEVRGYSLIFLLCTLSFLFMIRILKKHNVPDVAMYTVFTALMLYTHYYGLFVYAAQLLFLAVYFLLYRKVVSLSSLKYMVFSILLVVFIYLPWLPTIRKMAEVQNFWAGNPGHYFFITYFTSYFGREPFVYLISLLLIGLYLFCRSPGREFCGHKILLLSWVIVVLALPFIRSLDHRHPSLFHIRYTIVIVPALLLMVSRGIEQIRSLRFQCVVIATMLIMLAANIFFFSPGNYYRQVTKEQWREAARFIIGQDPVGRYPVYAPPYSEYYFKEIFRTCIQIRPPIATLEDAKKCWEEVSTGRIAGFWHFEAHLFSGDEVHGFLDSHFYKAEERWWLGTRVTLYLPAREK